MTTCRIEGCRYKYTHTSVYHTCKCGDKGHGQRECTDNTAKENLKQFYKEEIPPLFQCTLGTCGDDKKYHTSSAHSCTICNMRHSETECLQKHKYYELPCPMCKTINFIDKKLKKIYGLLNKCVICLTNNVELLYPQCGHVIICIECFNECIRNSHNELLDETDEAYYINRGRNILQSLPGNIYCELYGGMGCVWFIKRVNDEYSAFFMHSDCWGQYGPDTDDRPKLELFLSGANKV